MISLELLTIEVSILKLISFVAPFVIFRLWSTLVMSLIGFMLILKSAISGGSILPNFYHLSWRQIERLVSQ